MGKFFITYDDHKVVFKNKATGEEIELPKYAVWGPGKRGRAEVQECSNDLAYLQQKWNVQDDEVYPLKAF